MKAFPVTSRTLANGLRVRLLEHRSVPAVSINLTFLSGAFNESASQAGLALMVSRLLDEGTATRTSLQIAEQIESIGGALETDGSFERIHAGASVLTRDLDIGLELLADIARNPAFPEEFVAKEKDRMLAEMKSLQDRPQARAGWAFNELIYEAHPLGRPLAGHPETIKSLSRDDLLAFHAKHFVPNNAILSIVGDFSAESLLARIGELFGDWRGSLGSPVALPEPARQRERRHRVVSMPAEQVNIYLGHLGIRRSNPDFYALQVLDTILGGGAGFTARIPQRLRDEQGLAYTTYATITSTAGLEPGRFQAYIATSRKNVTAAVEGLLAEIRKVIEEPVSLTEIEDAKAYLTGSFVFGFESAAQLARFLTHEEVHGLGTDYVERYPDLVNQVSSEDLLRVASHHLSADAYSLVAAGPVDAASLAPFLERQ